MVDFFNVWDIVTGVLSLSATFLVAYIYHQLPSKKVKVLRALLKETEDLYASCMEEGLLNEQAVEELGNRLSGLLTRTNDVHMRVKSTQSRFKDVANVFNGLGRKIDCVCKDVQTLGVAISTTSLRERERLEAERREAANAQATVLPTTSVPSPTSVSSPSPSSNPPEQASAEVAAHLAPEASQLLSDTRLAAEDSFTHPAVLPLEKPSSESENIADAPQVDAPHPMPTLPTTPLEPLRRASTQDSCSESWVSKPSILPTFPVPRDEHTSGIHALARFARQACKRHSIQSQHSDVVYLLELPSIELVDEPNEEHPNSYHA